MRNIGVSCIELIISLCILIGIFLFTSPGNEVVVATLALACSLYGVVKCFYVQKEKRLLLILFVVLTLHRGVQLFLGHIK